MTRYLLMGTAAALLFFSILCRFFPGMRLKRLLGETANLSVSPNTILRQCVLKYSSLCELNGGRMNTSVYVEKFLRQLKFGRFSLRFWDRLGGQLLLLSVFADGIGACMGLMGGQTLGNVIWFYLQAFLSLYLYFAVIGMIDTASTAEELKITLADFLENRMSERLAQVKRDNDYLDEQEREVRREVESVEQTAAVRRMQEPREAESELQRWKGEIAPQLESIRSGMPRMHDGRASRTIRADGAFAGVFGLKCGVFFATLIGKQQTARVRRMKKNPGGRRNEPQK